jgi:serine protease Do
MMNKLLLMMLLLGVTNSALAVPTKEMLNKVTKQVVKLKVALNNGNDGTGSGVVIAKDRIATNCHVVANASSINVFVGDKSFTAQSITPDWYHDICLVKVEGLDAPIATIGKSKNLEYQQPVFAIGYPNISPNPVSSFGYVEGLLTMDDSVIVRTSSTFERGESGGGLFDDAGNLVGLITLKSPGKQAYYYNMPVEWLLALIDQPEQVIHSKPAPAFWATNADQWPLFMQVVHPYLTRDWHKVMDVATEWTKREPNNIEAWFYLATAEFALHDMENAQNHMRKVNRMNARYPQATYYLDLMVNNGIGYVDPITNVALLTD